MESIYLYFNIISKYIKLLLLHEDFTKTFIYFPSSGLIKKMTWTRTKEYVYKDQVLKA